MPLRCVITAPDKGHQAWQRVTWAVRRARNKALLKGATARTQLSRRGKTSSPDYCKKLNQGLTKICTIQILKLRQYFSLHNLKSQNSNPCRKITYYKKSNSKLNVRYTKRIHKSSFSISKNWSFVDVFLYTYRIYPLCINLDPFSSISSRWGLFADIVL